MKPCLCHGHDYPHEWRAESWCCGLDPKPEEDEDADVEPLDYYNKEESRYLDRINAADINRHRE